MSSDSKDRNRKDVIPFNGFGLTTNSFSNAAQPIVPAVNPSMKALMDFMEKMRSAAGVQTKMTSAIPDTAWGLSGFRNHAQEALDAANARTKLIGEMALPGANWGLSSGLGAFQPTLSSLSGYASPMRQAQEKTESYGDKKQRVQETPYVNASVAPVLKQKAALQETAIERPRLVENSKRNSESTEKVVSVSPAVEANKLLRGLTEVAVESRDDQRQIISLMKAILTKQTSMEIEIKELRDKESDINMLRQEVVEMKAMLKAVHCDVGTIARHIHRFFTDMPDVELPDDKEEDTDSEQLD